jgi:hypothetical protein
MRYFIKTTINLSLGSSLVLILLSGCSRPIDKPQEGLISDDDKTLGIGVISINYTSNGQEDSTLKFFNAAQDKAPAYHFIIRELDEAFRKREDTMGLRPFEFMPTPGRIMFRCIDSTEQGYKIVINENPDIICWLNKAANINFMNWLSYLESCDYIQTSNPLRAAPDNNSSVIFDKDSCSMYNILTMKGDWIEVQTSGYCDIYSNKSGRHAIKGWVKWRKGDKLNVGKMYAE